MSGRYCVNLAFHYRGHTEQNSDVLSRSNAGVGELYGLYSREVYILRHANDLALLRQFVWSQAVFNNDYLLMRICKTWTVTNDKF